MTNEIDEMLKKTGLNAHSDSEEKTWNSAFQIPALITDCFSGGRLYFYHLKRSFQQTQILSLSFFILLNTFFPLFILSAFFLPICPLSTGEKGGQRKKKRYNFKQQRFLDFFLKTKFKQDFLY